MLFREPGWEASVAFLALQDRRVMSAGSLVELQAVIRGRVRGDAYGLMNALMARLRIEGLDLTVDQADVARRAYLEFGRGSGPPAGLNFGDLFGYALAKTLRWPLAFVGDDLWRTDLETVRLPVARV